MAMKRVGTSSISALASSSTVFTRQAHVSDSFFFPIQITLFFPSCLIVGDRIVVKKRKKNESHPHGWIMKNLETNWIGLDFSGS